MARGEGGDEELLTVAAIQVVRRGLERVTAAAVLQRNDALMTPGDGEQQQQQQQQDGGDGNGQSRAARWTITVFELLDNDQLSNLDSLLTQSGARVVLYPEEESSSGKRSRAADGEAPGAQQQQQQQAAAAEHRKLLLLLERLGVETRAVPKKNAYKAGDDLERALGRLLGDGGETGASLAKYKKELEYAHGMGCVACLLREKGLLDASALDETGGEVGAYALQLGSLQEYMRIDSAAAEAMNLFPPADPSQQGAIGPYASVFQLLNHCKTKMGERLLKRWLRQPLVDCTRIEARLDLVQQLKDDIHLRAALQDSALRGVHDLDTLALRLQRKRAGLLDMYKVYLFAQKLPHFTGALDSSSSTTSNQDNDQDHDHVGRRFRADFARLRQMFAKYCELVECVIDTSALPELSINPAHDPALAEIKEQMEEVKGEIEALFDDAKDGWASRLGIDLRLEADKTTGAAGAGGHVFRATKQQDDKKLRSCKDVRVEVLSILKNGVHFTTPQLKRLSQRHGELKAEYQQKQAGLVRKATETALTYLPLMEAASRLVAELDVLVSLAHVAALAPNGGYTRPTLLPDGRGCRLLQARHPCLEMQENVSFIPNDYTLVPGESHFTLLTGPNMGGKSTYIRALGCLVVMAQIGSFVPAASAELSVVDAVLARVGAGDAAQQGISTFMAEMLEAATILQTATPNSLLIIDELGRGTSTFDGFGLAWAISEYILLKLPGCRALFATHFHELTALEQHQQGVRNLHVSALATPKAITMLYEVKPGPCLESYGIHVARMAQFPDSVIAEAVTKAKELEHLGSKDAFGQQQQEQQQQSPPTKRARVAPSPAMSLSERAQALLAQEKCQSEGAKAVLRATGDDFLQLNLDSLPPQEALAALKELGQGAQARLAAAAEAQ